MTEQRDLAETIRAKILSEPDMILGDADLMRALITATEGQRGNNVVDLRGVAMDRLEARLTRLEDTHQSVIAAAYDNLAGTNQIHRAVLSLLEPVDFEDFLHRLSGEVADILRVGRIRLVLESHDDADDPALASVADILSVAEPGFVDEYITLGRDMSPRQVTLRGIAIKDPLPEDATTVAPTAPELPKQSSLQPEPTVEPTPVQPQDRRRREKHDHKAEPGGTVADPDHTEADTVDYVEEWIDVAERLKRRRQGLN